MNTRSSCLLTLLLSAGAAAQSATWVSVVSFGDVPNGPSDSPALSADGRFVAFRSAASNLLPFDSNAKDDVFVRDLLLGTIVRASLSNSGAQSDGDSGAPAISADGRFVAFQSLATNLAPGDTNGACDVFVRDLKLGRTVRASVGSDGVQGDGDSDSPAMSADGRWVVFMSAAGNFAADGTVWHDVFVRDLLSGSLELADVSSSGAQANFGALQATISADGRWVAFSSYATNLVQGDDNGEIDVFRHDRLTGATTCVSVQPDGSVAQTGGSYLPALSADGRFVGFRSNAADLVPGDSNWLGDIFERDCALGTTACISVDPTGQPALGGFSDTCVLSADGQRVAFGSHATNLVPLDANGAEDVFLRDVEAGQTLLASADPSGQPTTTGASTTPSVSIDGRYVAFASDAAGIDPLDANGVSDVFVRDLGAASPWTDLGFALAGVDGLPVLAGSGAANSGATCALTLTHAAPSAPCLVLLSLGSVLTPFKGGTLVAAPFNEAVQFFTDPAGSITMPFVWPAGLPDGLSLWFQVLIDDPVAVKHVALSNAVRAVTEIPFTLP